MQFHQHPDGFIYLRGDRGELYAQILEIFEQDFDELLPDLPPRADERIYEPGVRHAILNRQGLVEGGPMPWNFGHRALTKLTELISKQQAREEEAKAAMEAALAEFNKTLRK